MFQKAGLARVIGGLLWMESSLRWGIQPQAPASNRVWACRDGVSATGDSGLLRGQVSLSSFAGKKEAGTPVLRAEV